MKSDYARVFYEAEALRGGWTIRQLDRQIGSQFYERNHSGVNRFRHSVHRGRFAMGGQGHRPAP